MLYQIFASSYSSSSYGPSVGDASGFFAALATYLIAMLVAILVISIVTIIGMWKVFEKAGYEGWKAIIPIYNLYILTEISGQNGMLVLLILIPGIGSLIWTVMVAAKMAPAFGKDAVFAVGLFLLAPIFYCILGFGDAQYQLNSAAADNAQPSNPTTDTPESPNTPEAPQTPQNQDPTVQA
jgi:hypothetical protein